MEMGSPLNANVEQVLPGVIMEIGTVRGEVARGFESVNSRLDHVDSRIEAFGEGFDDVKRIGAAFRLAFSASGPSDLTNSGLILPGLGSARTANQSTGLVNPSITRTDAEQLHNHRPSPMHASLTSIWDEWHGRGLFQDRPVVGGLKELEQLKGGSWRTHFVASEKTAFSRMKAIIEGIENYSRSVGLSVEMTLPELDAVFQATDGVKCQCAKMVTWFQNKDMISKKQPRGRRTGG